jgi:hypothetical protein
MSLVRYTEFAPGEEDENNGEDGETEGDDDAADEGNTADETHDGDEAHVGDGEENAEEVADENEDGCGVVNKHIVVVASTSWL